MKVVVYTLGCKVNQYESDSILSELNKNGYITTTNLECADVYILNTCAVTNEAERKSRGMIAKFVKLNSNCKIVVCGCASEHIKKQFEKYPNVCFVIGNFGKSCLAKNIINILKNEYDNNFDKISSIREYEKFDYASPTKTRAYLKIQDGCNNFCSYCLIPFVRGRSRSRDINEIYEEAVTLSKVSKEIILTGINISDYRIDGKLALGSLMLKLSNLQARIRIGSLEVNIIDDEFLTTLKQCKNFCPHFHLSMQSGCDKILSLMNRHYTSVDYLTKIALIKKYYPFACITTDVICGFPTESEEDFNETLETIKSAEFYFMHIFPYSIRQGTKASLMKQVDILISKNRVDRLIGLRNEQRKLYLEKIKDVEQTVIVEEQEDDYMVGHTEYYVKCFLPKECKQGQTYTVKTTCLYKDGAFAIICK